MHQPVATYVIADDPISTEGVAAQLRRQHDIQVVDRPDEAEVAVVVADLVDAHTIERIRVHRRGGGCRVLLVVGRADDDTLLAAVEAGVGGLLRRSDGDGHRLAAAVTSTARGDGTLPPDLVGRLLDTVGQLHRQLLAPRGLHLRGLADREIDVLKLVADGFDTAEIASKLCYSERTVKNVLHAITTRLHLRNRCHAVAYALRQGLI